MRLNKVCKCRYSEEDILKCTNTRRRNGADVVNDTISPKGLAIRKGDRSGLADSFTYYLKMCGTI